LLWKAGIVLAAGGALGLLPPIGLNLIHQIGA
jgi:hypothetical protein